MRFDKTKAFELRRKGESYKAIRKALGMSIATLSDWFKDEEWSKEIKYRLASDASAKNSYKLTLMQQARRRKLDLLYERARNEAILAYNLHRKNPLFIAGIMIYWGEGDKRSKSHFSIANTEAPLIRVFLHFLTDICKVDKSKIKAWILLYPELEDKICKKYWMQSCNLTESSFRKSVTIQGKSTIHRLSYGVCSVGFHNRYFKEKMLTWLQLAAEDLGTQKKAGIV